MHRTRLLTAEILVAGLLLTACAEGPSISSAPAAASPSPNFATDTDANGLASSAADRLATAFGFTNSAAFGSPNADYFGTTIRPDGLEIALTRAPDAAPLAQYRQTAAPVPLDIRIVAHSWNELNAVTMSVGAQGDAITALGINGPLSYGPDNDTDLVVLTTPSPFPADAPAKLRDLVGPLVIPVYDPNAPRPATR